MQDLDKALAEIDAIKTQLARGETFHGLGPTAFAATGVFALLVAGGEAVWMPSPGVHGVSFLILWIAVAAVSAAVIGYEMIGRSRRMHSQLADEMIAAAVWQFLPAATAGVLVTAVLYGFAQAELWMAPALWQLCFSLGVFASCRFLPRGMLLVGAWHLATGLGCLAFAQGPHAFSPWTMGLAFGVGQILVAAVLRFSGTSDD
ncbi:MAG TPA: hypothetical protein VGI95_01040 [Caulobacteraceae bacterium]|jgi:hypothetical protein